MPHGEDACPKCRLQIQYVEKPFCHKCGKPLVLSDEIYCNDCNAREHTFECGRAVFVYNDVMRRSIADYKYKHRREYASFYVQEVLRTLGTEIKEWNADAIIPIPLHKSREQKRGFNQAEVLAKGIGEALKIPVCTDLVSRCKKTTAQKQLNNRERQNNLKKAFKIIGNDVKLKTVILCDDIYTTGSTMDTVATLLKRSGVQEVYFIALAIGKGF